MAHQPWSEIIENHIETGLTTFRASFNSVCETWGFPSTPDSLVDLSQDGTTGQLRKCTLLTV